MVLSVKYGEIIPEVCQKVQENIINAVETMAGLRVSQVNIRVESVDVKKEREKKDNE